MFNILVVCTWLCVLGNLEYLKADAESSNSDLQACETPDGFSGFCKPVSECKPVASIVNNSKLMENVTENYIRGLQCTISGERSSVCCPSDEDEFMKRLLRVNAPINLLPDPNKLECGFYRDNIIVNPNPELDDFPWTAILHYKQNSNENVIQCTGSLISSKYVVTVAHCVQLAALVIYGQLTHVTLGEYNIESERDCIENYCADPTVTVDVESITVHPDLYIQDRRKISNDIALIRLTKDVNFTTFIMPVCLPQPNLEIQENQSLEITGWERLDFDKTSNIKLKSTIRATNRSLCKQKYKSETSVTVGDGVFCAELDRVTDICTIISGGPAMFNALNENGVMVSFLAGMASFGSTSCRKDYPDLYTYVSKYSDWIKMNVLP